MAWKRRRRTGFEWQILGKKFRNRKRGRKLIGRHIGSWRPEFGKGQEYGLQATQDYVDAGEFQILHESHCFTYPAKFFSFYRKSRYFGEGEVLIKGDYIAPEDGHFKYRFKRIARLWSIGVWSWASVEEISLEV